MCMSLFMLMNIFIRIREHAVANMHMCLNISVIVCVSLGVSQLKDHIKLAGRDPLISAVNGVGEFEELSRSWECMVLNYRFPVGAQHLLSAPKGTLYDLRQLRRSHLPLVQKLRADGIACLRTRIGLSSDAPDPRIVCGFSYPADYNQVHLHLVMPPFRHMLLFRRSVFYLYEEVVASLDRSGIVKPHPAVDLRADKAQMEYIVALDKHR